MANASQEWSPEAVAFADDAALLVRAWLAWPKGHDTPEMRAEFSSRADAMLVRHLPHFGHMVPDLDDLRALYANKDRARSFILDRDAPVPVNERMVVTIILREMTNTFKYPINLHSTPTFQAVATLLEGVHRELDLEEERARKLAGDPTRAV